MALDHRHKGYADRLAVLVSESVQLRRRTSRNADGFDYLADRMGVESWRVRAANMVHTVFGPKSVHAREFARIEANAPHLDRPDDLERLEGVLRGGLEDLRGGFLQGALAAAMADVLDSVLLRAGDLLAEGHVDCAAMLGRVVLEDALRSLARTEGVDVSGLSTGQVNDLLKQAGVYAKPRWRQVQSWLDIGNAAAHGENDDYDAAQVREMLSGIQGFLALESSA